MKTNDATELRKKVIADSLQRCGVIDATVKDAPEAIAFLTSQLAYIENRIYERKRQPMQYAQLVPVSTEAGEWATSIEYETYDYAGRGKKHSGKGGDIPRVDVAYNRKSLSVAHGAIGYDFSQQELRESAYLRRPLNERRAAVAMEAYERHINDVALNGESESGFSGLFNNGSVPQANVPNGAGGTATWASKTPTEILKDVNDAIASVWTATAYNDVPNTVVIAPTQYAYISSTPVSPTFPDKTILKYLQENVLPKVERGIDVQFVPGYGLQTAGAGGTARFMVYVKDETRLKMHLPMPLRFLAPQLEGLNVTVPGEYRYGMTHWFYVKSAAYRDGI